VGGLTPIFWQNTLPLMITILVAVGGAIVAGWISNANLSKRVDDTNKRIDDVHTSLSKRDDDLNTSLSKRIDDVHISLSGRIDGFNVSLSGRMDDLNTNLSKRLDDIIARLGRIEMKLDDHQDRIARLEERTSPLRR